MKAYIWKELEGLTKDYHDGGGALVIADSLDAAKFLLRQEAPKVNFYRGGFDAHRVWRKNINLIEPNYVFGLAGKQDELVVIFPNAGCC